MQNLLFALILASNLADVAEVFHHQAFACLTRSQYARAGELWEVSLALYEIAPRKHQEEIATTHTLIGMVDLIQNKQLRSLMHHNEALRIRLRCKSDALAGSYWNLASLYTEMGQFTVAEKYLRESLRISSPKIRNSPGEQISSKSLIGKALQYKREYAKAEKCFLEVQRLCKKHGEDRGPSYLCALRMLVRACLLQGKVKEAKAHMKEAKKEARDWFGHEREILLEKIMVQTILNRQVPISSIQTLIKQCSEFGPNDLLLAHQLAARNSLKNRDWAAAENTLRTCCAVYLTKYYYHPDFTTSFCTYIEFLFKGEVRVGGTIALATRKQK